MNTRRQQNTPIKQGLGVMGQQQYGSYAQQQQQQKPTPEANPIVGGTQASVPAVDANGKKPKPEWQLKKANPELRRLRQNARVKKVVKPKTAIMVLHEMYPDIVYKIDEVASNKTSIYRVHFELDKKQYSGEGFSKTQAKQNACENALKAMLLERIAKEQEAEKAAAKASEKDKDNSMETDETTESDKKIPTDDFPWGKLAGFAMQKLMDSWTSNEKVAVAGVDPRPPFVPMMGGVGPYGGHQTFSHPNHMSFSNYSAGPGAGGFQFQRDTFQPSKVESGPRKPTVPCKKFPENPLEYNPVALCNQTWPHMEPTFESSRNAEGHPVHTASLTLEGFRFSALGKNKKEVKLQLCKAVISTLKGVKYPDGFTAQVMQA